MERRIENRNGIVTMAELQRYVLKESEEYCKRYSDDCRLGLTPQVQVASGGLKVPAFENAHVSLPRNATHCKRHSRSPVEVGWHREEKTTSGCESTRDRVLYSEPIWISSSKATVLGYLVLLDINAAGELVQIFPNEGSLRSGVSSLISAGKPVRLPGEKAGFRFRAIPPVGSGLLVAIVTEKNDRVRGSWLRDTRICQWCRLRRLILLRLGKPFVLELHCPNNARGAGWNIATLQYKIAFTRFGTKQDIK